MSKAEKLRNALPTTESAAIDAAELSRLTGIKNVPPSLSSMIKTDEVGRIGKRGGLRYWRKPDFVSGAQRRKKPRGGGDA